MHSLKFGILTAFKICLRCKQVFVYKMHTYPECQKACRKLYYHSLQILGDSQSLKVRNLFLK